MSAKDVQRGHAVAYTNRQIRRDCSRTLLLVLVVGREDVATTAIRVRQEERMNSHANQCTICRYRYCTGVTRRFAIYISVSPAQLSLARAQVWGTGTIKYSESRHRLALFVCSGRRMPLQGVIISFNTAAISALWLG